MTSKPLLTERDHKLLLQGKTDMITAEVVWRRFFPDRSLEAARSAIRRLCGPDQESQFLQAECLDRRRVYYRLTPLATRVLGISPKYAVPLKKLGRVRRYALAWFIHAEYPGQRMIINLADHRKRFGLTDDRLPRHPFYIDRSSGQEKLGIILIDHHAHVRHIVFKTLKPLGRCIRHGCFNHLIAAGCFVVAVLTSSASRQRAIRMQLEDAIKRHFGYALSTMPAHTPHSQRARIEVLVPVIPGMDAILAAPSNQEKTR